MPNTQRGVMGARIGSVAVLLLLIGVAQYCQASRDQALPGSGLTETPTRTSITAPTNATSTTTVTSSNTKSVQRNDPEEFETDDALDESGHVKFENLRASTSEGVLDGPAPEPSSAFSMLPSLLTPALALSVSFAVLAAKM